MTRRGFMQVLAAIGGTLVLPFRARAREKTVIIKDQMPENFQPQFTCGFCGQPILLRGPDDAMVLNTATNGRFAHEQCYRQRVGEPFSGAVVFGTVEDKNGHAWKGRVENGRLTHICPHVCVRCGALSGTDKAMARCQPK